MWRTLTALAFGAVLSACASDKQDPAVLAAMAACAELASAECGALSRCPSHQGLVERFGDPSTCAVRLELSCRAELSARDVTRTAEQLRSCAAAWRSRSCEAAMIAPVPKECAPPAGPRPNGARCRFDAQCSSAFCGVATGQRCGTCLPLPVEGDSCLLLGCGGALVCAGDLCTPPGVRDVGDACGSSLECAPDLGCVATSSLAEARACAPVVTSTGAACDRARGPYCDGRRDLGCTRAGTCETLQFGFQAAACGFFSGDDQLSLCAAGGTCVSDTASTASCLPAADDGDVCSPVTGPGCLEPAECVTGPALHSNGVCAIPAGDRCDD